MPSLFATTTKSAPTERRIASAIGWIVRDGSGSSIAFDDVGRRRHRIRDRERALLVLLVDLRRHERVGGERPDDDRRSDHRDLQEQQLR